MGQRLVEMVQQWRLSRFWQEERNSSGDWFPPTSILSPFLSRNFEGVKMGDEDEIALATSCVPENAFTEEILEEVGPHELFLESRTSKRFRRV